MYQILLRHSTAFTKATHAVGSDIIAFLKITPQMYDSGTIAQVRVEHSSFLHLFCERKKIDFFFLSSHFLCFVLLKLVVRISIVEILCALNEWNWVLFHSMPKESENKTDCLCEN